MDILNFISWIKGGRQVTTVDPSKTLLPVGLKDGRRDDGYLAGAITVQDFLNLVPALEGTSFITVLGDKATPAENGLDLQAAYDAAKLATPYGNPLSDTNRFTILVAPGDYYSDAISVPYGPIGQFQINAEFIDILSLSGNADVYLSGISVSALDTYLRGLNTSRATQLGGAQEGFNLVTTSNTQTFDTCVGGDYSFGWGGYVSSKFINCTAGDYSFCSIAASTAPQGITNNNTGGYNYLEGTLINCTAGIQSFGYTYMPMAGIGAPLRVTGTFIGCTGDMYCFGAESEIYGSFTDCTGGNFCFGTGNQWGFSQLIGTFTDCKAGEVSFGGGTSISLSAQVVSGTFNNCIAGGTSFGFRASGLFTNCTASNGSFAPGGFYGSANNCTGGDLAFGGQPGSNGFNGTANNCIGGFGSFGNFSQMNGFAYYCKSTGDLNIPPTAPAKFVLCINGNNDIVTTP